MRFSSNTRQMLLFAGAVLMYFALNMQRVAIPGTIFNELQSTFSTSATALANLSNIFMIAYALAQFPAGILADRFGGFRTILAGGSLMTLGCILFACAPVYGLLAFSRFLIGFGGGFIYLSLAKEIGRRYPKQFVTVAGLVLLLGYIGGFFATMPLARLTVCIGWRPAIFSCAVVSILSIVIMLVFWRSQPPIAREISLPPGLQSYRQAFTNLNNLKMFLSYSVNFGLFSVVLAIFGKKFLEDIGGLSISAASVVCGLMVLFPALGNQLAGILSCRMGNRRRPFYLAACCLPVISCGLLLAGALPFMPAAVRQWLFVPAFLLFSLTGGFSSISGSMAREFNPPASTGVAIGALNFAAYTMVALWGLIAGAIMDQFQGAAEVLENGHVIYPAGAYVTIFAVFLVTSLLTFRLALSVPESRGENICRGKQIKVRIFRIFTVTLNI